MIRTVGFDTAEVFEPLLEPARYKGAEGGRGSGKSHFFAELAVETCLNNNGTHGVCIREVQKSLAQSAKRLIEMKIKDPFDAGKHFEIQRDRIITPGNGLIIFQGMQNHTADSLKSLEGFDFAWSEEAHTMSKRSLRLLRPTMRKRDSELWFSWNPENPTDPVDVLLRGDHPPPDSTVVTANWYDNPWFEETTLVEEKDFDYRRDPEMAAHVWGGEYLKRSQARVFNNWRVDWFEPPSASTILYAGADWGFSQDPTVLIILFVVGRTIYLWREVWAIGCEIDRTPALFDKIDPDWTEKKARDPNWKSLARRVPSVAESARPEAISYMKRNGFPKMRPAIKGAGSIEDGIEFLKSYDIVIHPDCVRAADEFARYSYKIDPHTEEITSALEEDDNHYIDAVRYALENVRRAQSTDSQGLR